MYMSQLHTRRMSSNALNFEGWVLQMTFELSKLVHLSTQLYSCKSTEYVLVASGSTAVSVRHFFLKTDDFFLSTNTLEIHR